MKRWIVCCSVVFAACGGPPKTGGEDLMMSVTTYNDGVRWERLAIAASRVPPAQREDFVDERDQLAENLRISDWEVKRIRDEAPGRAKVHVKYTWYNDDEGIVRETHAMQEWHRRGKAWLIVDERRLRGEEMPGLAEPEPEPEPEAEEHAEGPRDEAEAEEVR